MPFSRLAELARRPAWPDHEVVSIGSPILRAFNALRPGNLLTQRPAILPVIASGAQIASGELPVEM